MPPTVDNQVKLEKAISLYNTNFMSFTAFLRKQTPDVIQYLRNAAHHPQIKDEQFWLFCINCVTLVQSTST